MKNGSIFLMALIGVVGCGSPQREPATRPAVAMRALPTPPPMPRRSIEPGAEAGAGETMQIRDGDVGFTLFLPAGYRVGGSGEVDLVAHFHGAAWFGIQEHLRAGLKGPLICAELGQGSNVYRVPFEDRARFERLMGAVAHELKRRGAPANTRVESVAISSFSAGYGAVREIVKSPEYRGLIRRIVLCDSMYASFAEGSKDAPAREHIEPWVAFAQAAARGEKTFVLTYSQVPTATYASTSQCAGALVGAVGGPMLTPVVRGSIPATLEAEYPLLHRSDVGGFHVWGYAGADAAAHLTHVRHLADVWKALDEAGAR